MVGVMIDTGHGGSGVVGVRLVSSDVPRGWLQPCATSELSVVGACRALEQASRKICPVASCSSERAGLESVWAAEPLSPGRD